ncbi:MAG: YggU family protein [Verrucomicrobia bacterium]|nr:YggU family protein [Verrucomicrobiota bacterium]
MSTPAYLKTQGDGVVLSIKVQPRASMNEIGEAMGAELKVKVTAPPVDSAANEAVLRLLADVLDCPRGSVQLIRGNTSRHKQILIQRIPLETVVAKLGAKS